MRRQLPAAEVATSASRPVSFSRQEYKYLSHPFVMSRRSVTVKQFIEETTYVTDAEGGTPMPPENSSDSDTESLSGDDAAAKETSNNASTATLVIGGWNRKGDVFEWVDGWNWRSSMTLHEGVDHTVSVISWRDATEFCKWLTEKEGRQYRLPTNEEWTAAMQLGADRTPRPARKTDGPAFNDTWGWFDAKAKHPLGIDRAGSAFAEWTQDSQYGNKVGQMVLVHHELSADELRILCGKTV
ncbi:MAG: SUMF1/EgtB/PvdO family nonheme iron enzyme [Planctomycetales bacterium]|jgi:formylglycine-generating enzyme required for sulfatase activity